MSAGLYDVRKQTRCVVNNPEDCFGPCSCGERPLECQHCRGRGTEGDQCNGTDHAALNEATKETPK